MLSDFLYSFSLLGSFGGWIWLSRKGRETTSSLVLHHQEQDKGQCVFQSMKLINCAGHIAAHLILFIGSHLFLALETPPSLH